MTVQAYAIKRIPVLRTLVLGENNYKQKKRNLQMEVPLHCLLDADPVVLRQPSLAGLG